MNFEKPNCLPSASLPPFSFHFLPTVLFFKEKERVMIGVSIGGGSSYGGVVLKRSVENGAVFLELMGYVLKRKKKV